MKQNIFPKHRRSEWCLVFGFVLLIVAFIHANAWALTVNVVDQNGTAVAGFKWLLEEDNTHPPEPGVHKPVSADVNENTLSVGIHRSHARVFASGESAGSSAIINTIDLPGGSVPLPDGRYFVSVLPYPQNPQTDGRTFDVGGAPIDTTTQSEVTVHVRTNPIETTRMSIKVFHDIAPLNNAPDVGENGLAGFTVTLTDQGGDIVVNAFGHKLGTTYLQNPDGSFIMTCDDTGFNQGSGEGPCIDQVGVGDFITDADGEVLIEYVPANKYGIQVEPPAGQGWLQTTTIEGTKTIDAWVRPNEPPFLVEFGPPRWHAFYGFVQALDELDTLPPGPKTTIKGQVNKGHLSRPPQIAISNGPVPEGEAVGERCVVGLNSLGNAGLPDTVWIGMCEDGTGNYKIPNVPPGTYQLVIFDISLLHIINFNTVITGDTGGVIDLGSLPTPMWFGQQEHHVYLDADKDARRDPDEVGIPEQNINLRFRDGTIYQAFPTDGTGFVPFQGIFPFFHWQVAEVDFARFEATGVRVVVDEGGPVSDNQWGEGKRNPQIQANGRPFRREVGPVLTEAYQQFAGQNTRFEWGKAPYDNDVNVEPLNDFPGPGDTDVDEDGRYDNNGGISGVVFYATTRAEDDPRFAAGEEWEPGVPRVQVNLYRDVICNSNGGPAVYPICPEATPGEIGDDIPDDRINGGGNPVTAGVLTQPDVDNYPLNWAPANCETGGQTCSQGPEDIDHNSNGNFNIGDAIRVTWTDSWDDNLPEGCVGDVDPLIIHGEPVPVEQCGEGLRTWNQVRPGVFDGGYAFGPRDRLLVPGTYIVQAVTPPGYELLKEEDRNVDFGPTPVPAILPAKCVGDDHVVPPLFSFLTDDNGNPLPGVDPNSPDNEAPFAGDTRPLCDRKKMDLGSGQNSAADFFVFTQVPKATRAVGLITDDLANELAPGKPTFTEKFSPPWMPIAVFDYTG